MRNYLRVALCSVLFSTIGAQAENFLIVKEECISPDLEDFDCHGASIEEVAAGVLCAVWKGGPGKGLSNFDIKDNVGIWLSRCQDGVWSSPVQIVSALNTICWAPCLTKLPSGELLLFYRMGVDPRHVQAFLKRSNDGGITWSDAEILPAGILGPIRSKPFFDKEGSMICGSSMETGAPDEPFKATSCYIEISSDQGLSWQKYGPIEIPGKRFGAIEPTLFMDGEGNLKMLCRDRSNRIDEEGWIWTTTSQDGGKTWMPLEKTVLPNPDAGIDALDLGNGKILLAYNHSHCDRFPLNLALSLNGGDSWESQLVLEDKSGEFPAMICSFDGHIHVIYVWTPPGKTQRRIKHVEIVAS